MSFLSVVFWLLASLQSAFAALPTIEKLRAGEHPDYIRLVIELTQNAIPDVVPHMDGFAVYFNGVGAAGPGLSATAGPLNASLGLQSSQNTTVFVDGVTGPSPLRQFTLPAVNGTGVRLVMDFVPRLLSGPMGMPSGMTAPAPMISRISAAGTPGSSPFPARSPRLATVQWNVETVEGGDTQERRDQVAALGADVMADAPAPLTPPQKRLPPPPQAILSDSLGRERRGSFSYSGFIEAEARPYLQASEDGERPRATGSIAIQPSVEWRPNGNHSIKATGFARLDAVDSSRTHVDVREAKYVGQFGDFELTAGFDNLFWGTTESFHLVDIINQIDGVEDIDDEDKLGELMIAGRYISPIGTFSVFAMPMARQRTFPGADGRPNAGLLVDTDQATYRGDDDEFDFSFAGRYEATFDVLDIGLSYFSGTARDPRLTLGLDDDNPALAVLIPNYDKIDQIGIDTQLTLGPVLLKGEAIHQWNDFEDFTSFIAGFEYTLFGALGSADIGLLAEYLYDDRGEGAPVPFEDDVFVGARIGMNDTGDTQLLAGAIVDLDGDGVFLNVEASTRIGEKWRISLDARVFSNTATKAPVFGPFQDDDFVQIKLQRFF